MSVPEIDVDELARLRAAGGLTLIDVRQPDEFAEARVPGAVLVPLAEVPDRLDDVPEGETVYVICQSGGRSARAVEWLNSQGRDTVNVAGGTMGWIDAGNDTETG